MPGRRKIFDQESRRARYAAADVEDKLVMNLRDIQRTMLALYEGKGSWKRVLIILRRTGPITQKELTERLEIQPASVSDVLAKMEEMELIERRQCASDQRTADVVLTEKGVRMAAEAAEQRAQRHREMFVCLSDSEKQTLLLTLEKLNADWNKRFAD